MAMLSPFIELCVLVHGSMWLINVESYGNVSANSWKYFARDSISAIILMKYI